MKVSGEKGKQVEARYSLLENFKPVTEPEALAYWSGINECKDFSGTSLKEAFSYYPDEKIENGVYGLYWDTSTYSGNIYLYSLFFTPANRNYALSAVSSNVAFITPELSEQTTIELKGTKETTVDSIEGILELIAEKRVCISANDNKVSFWWNPKGLIDNDAFQVLANKECPQGD
jgi:hypothetical protein